MDIEEVVLKGRSKYLEASNKNSSLDLRKSVNLKEKKELLVKVYEKLVKDSILNQEKLEDMRDFYYCFVVKEILMDFEFENKDLQKKDLGRIEFERNDIEKIDSVFEDIGKIRKGINLNGIYNYLLKRISIGIYSISDIKEYKLYLSNLMNLSANAGLDIDGILSISRVHLNSIILKSIKNSQSFEDIINIFLEIEELIEIRFIENIPINSLTLAIKCKFEILKLNPSFDALEVIKSMKQTLESKLSQNSFKNLEFLFIALNLNNFNFATKPKLQVISNDSIIPGKVLSFYSNSRVRLTVQVFNSKPEFKYESFIVRKYEFLNDPEIVEKIEQEIEYAKLFEDLSGFSKLLYYKQETVGDLIRFVLCFSGSRLVNLNLLTETFLHSMINVYFYLFQKRLACHLPDINNIFIDESNHYTINNFSLINFQGIPITSQNFLDINGDYSSLPLITESSIKLLSNLIQTLSTHLPPSSQQNLRSRFP